MLSVSDSADLLGEVLTRHGFAYALGSTGGGETRFSIRFAGAPAAAATHARVGA